jgi:hypothetical protein
MTLFPKVLCYFSELDLSSAAAKHDHCRNTSCNCCAVLNPAPTRVLFRFRLSLVLISDLHQIILAVVLFLTLPKPLHGHRLHGKCAARGLVAATPFFLDSTLCRNAHASTHTHTHRPAKIPELTIETILNCSFAASQSALAAVLWRGQGRVKIAEQILRAWSVISLSCAQPLDQCAFACGGFQWQDCASSLKQTYRERRVMLALRGNICEAGQGGSTNLNSECSLGEVGRACSTTEPCDTVPRCGVSATPALPDSSKPFE